MTDESNKCLREARGILDDRDEARIEEINLDERASVTDEPSPRMREIATEIARLTSREDMADAIAAALAKVEAEANARHVALSTPPSPDEAVRLQEQIQSHRAAHDADIAAAEQRGFAEGAEAMRDACADAMERSIWIDERRAWARSIRALATAAPQENG